MPRTRPGLFDRSGSAPALLILDITELSGAESGACVVTLREGWAGPCRITGGRRPNPTTGLSRASTVRSMEDQIYDSPAGWVAKHIREYVESEGRQGHRWNGVTTLLLTTRGRRTGKLRRTALIYGQDGDAYVVVASRGGAPHHPQ